MARTILESMLDHDAELAGTAPAGAVVSVYADEAEFDAAQAAADRAGVKRPRDGAAGDALNLAALPVVQSRPRIESREDWLREAVEGLRPVFAGVGLSLPDVRIGCGDLGKRRLGVSFPREVVEDRAAEITVTLRHETRPVDILGTVAHELIHAAGIRNHYRDFQSACRKLSLRPASGTKWSTAGWDGLSVEDLPDGVGGVLARLGDWPAPRVVPGEKAKKQRSRMVKVTCESCAVVWRAAASHLRGGVACPMPACEGPAVVHWPEGEDGEGGEGS